MLNILISHALCAVWLGIFTIHLSTKPAKAREMNYSIVFQHWQINGVIYGVDFPFNSEACCVISTGNNNHFLRAAVSTHTPGQVSKVLLQTGIH